MPAEPAREALVQELDKWNVRYRFGDGGRHKHVIVEAPRGEFFWPFTCAKKVDSRGIKNSMSILRRILITFGAKKVDT